MRVTIAASMPEVEWDSDASGDICSRNSELSCYACVYRYGYRCVHRKKIATGRGAIGEEFAERRRSHEVTMKLRTAALARASVISRREHPYIFEHAFVRIHSGGKLVDACDRNCR